MKGLLFILVISNIIFSQDYKLTCLGFHIADIKQSVYKFGKIEYQIQTKGLIDLFWPTTNSYSTIYNPKTYKLKSWKKDIQQGLHTSLLIAEVDSINNFINYDNKSVEVKDSVYTIFTMLAMVQSLPIELIDTKWFPYEHQGETGKARFLWSDSTMVWDGKDSTMCDHYRMDINIIDSTYIINKREDCFMENVKNPNYTKELWIKRGKNKTIIQASIRNDWIRLFVN
tara:strand:- start:2341 stop:3021 length:681 start_codon:yes stop_codon:yes gene_type:complete